MDGQHSHSSRGRSHGEDVEEGEEFEAAAQTQPFANASTVHPRHVVASLERTPRDDRNPSVLFNRGESPGRPRSGGARPPNDREFGRDAGGARRGRSPSPRRQPPSAQAPLLPGHAPGSMNFHDSGGRPRAPQQQHAWSQQQQQLAEFGPRSHGGEGREGPRDPRDVRGGRRDYFEGPPHVRELPPPSVHAPPHLSAQRGVAHHALQGHGREPTAAVFGNGPRDSPPAFVHSGGAPGRGSFDAVNTAHRGAAIDWDEHNNYSAHRGGGSEAPDGRHAEQQRRRSLSRGADQGGFMLQTPGIGTIPTDFRRGSNDRAGGGRSVTPLDALYPGDDVKRSRMMGPDTPAAEGFRGGHIGDRGDGRSSSSGSGGSGRPSADRLLDHRRPGDAFDGGGPNSDRPRRRIDSFDGPRGPPLDHPQLLLRGGVGGHHHGHARDDLPGQHGQYHHQQQQYAPILSGRATAAASAGELLQHPHRLDEQQQQQQHVFRPVEHHHDHDSAMRLPRQDDSAMRLPRQDDSAMRLPRVAAAPVFYHADDEQMMMTTHRAHEQQQQQPYRGGDAPPQQQQHQHQSFRGVEPSSSRPVFASEPSQLHHREISASGGGPGAAMGPLVTAPAPGALLDASSAAPASYASGGGRRGPDAEGGEFMRGSNIGGGGGSSSSRPLLQAPLLPLTPLLSTHGPGPGRSHSSSGHGQPQQRLPLRLSAEQHENIELRMKAKMGAAMLEVAKFKHAVSASIASAMLARHRQVWTTAAAETPAPR